MFRSTRQRSPPIRMNSNFPTHKKFLKIIDPIIHTKKVEKRIGPPIPLLPEYLTEMSSDDNPYTITKIKRIEDLKDLEKIRRNFEKHKIRDFKVQEIVNRNMRNKFNAHYDLRKLIYSIDMKEIMSGLSFKSISEKSEVPIIRFISNSDFLLDKRRLCLLDLAIDIKEEQLMTLDMIIARDEKLLKTENKLLEEENETHEQFLKNICHKTSDAIKLAEKKTAKRNLMIDRVKKARYNMAHLNAECVKLEEEYMRLKMYKEFLRNCHVQRENKQTLERTSFLEELKLDVLMAEAEAEGKSTDDSRGSIDEDHPLFKQFNLEIGNTNNLAFIKNNQNAQRIIKTLELNNQNRENSEDPKRTFNKEDLNKLKIYILQGFSNVNNPEVGHLFQTKRSTLTTEIDEDSSEKKLDEADLYENDMFFSSPQDLVDLLSDLEGNNLSLIENVQEQEEMCDHLRSKIRKIRTEMDSQMALIDKHVTREQERIANLEDSINCIKETNEFLLNFNDLDRYKKIFNFGDLEFTTSDEMMDYLHEKISTLYHSVFEKVDSSKSNTLEMLKRIESLIDALYIELQSYDRNLILKAKRIVDERKREASRLRQKQLSKEAEALKLEKAMIKAQMPPRYKYGRKVMYRSDQPKQILHVDEINWDEIRAQEEYTFFFT